MCLNPLTITCVCSEPTYTVGVDQVGTSVRAVRQSVLPVFKSSAAMKEFFCTSHWMITLSS